MIKSETIKYNDIFVKVNRGDLPDNHEEMVIGEAYVLDNSVYIYKGLYDENLTPKQTKNGLYYDANEEAYIVTDDSDLSVDDIVDTLGSILNNIKKMSTVRNDIKKSSTKSSSSKSKRDSSASRKKLPAGKRTRRDDILNMTINENDNLLVKLIKEAINSSNITMNDIYKEHDADGYNLFYGLSTRNNLQWESFEKWCAILDMEYDVILQKKKH